MKRIIGQNRKHIRANSEFRKLEKPSIRDIKMTDFYEAAINFKEKFKVEGPI